MPFLLRVELPDVPGSLGRVAAAIGEAGGDIEAIEIVEKTRRGTAVDDVLMEMAPGAMPDSVVSACGQLEGVRVLWISRYAAGGNLFLDLEAVETLTEDPEQAVSRLVALLPVTFRVDWGARLRRTAEGVEVVDRTEGTPADLPWPETGSVARVDLVGPDTLCCAVPLAADDVVVIGRHGGPEFLDSELARFRHLAHLAHSISNP